MKVLISPLDWGLGHAARLIPIIRQQLALGHEVTIASQPLQAGVIQRHFPALEIITDFPAYSPVYYSHLPISLSMLMQSPRFLATVLREKLWLRDVMKHRRFDHIISDHRLGLYHPDVRSTLLIHQICIHSVSLLKPVLRSLQSLLIHHFDECWIPDYPDQRLSGALSSNDHITIPIKFIGPLSRFDGPIPVGEDCQYKWMVIASGPDPLRDVFVKRMMAILEGKGYKSLVLCGLPDRSQEGTRGNVVWVSHLNDAQFQRAISQSESILCRSGYSTLMDLDVFQRRALLVPTTGQTEQEFLAHFHAKSGNHDVCLERDMNDFFNRDYQG